MNTNTHADNCVNSTHIDTCKEILHNCSSNCTVYLLCIIYYDFIKRIWPFNSSLFQPLNRMSKAKSHTGWNFQTWLNQQNSW